MKHSNPNHVWSQNCCSDLYGLKGSSLLRHWPHPTAMLGVVRCALYAFVNTTNCDVVLHCCASWSPTLHRVWPEHAANAKMPSHVECVCSFFDKVCMCALAAQRMWYQSAEQWCFPMAERSPLHQNIGPRLQVNYLFECQPSLLRGWYSTMRRFQIALSNPATIKLFLNCRF